MIKAILFDIDGVLVDTKDAQLKFREKVFRLAGYNDVPDEFFYDFHKPYRTLITDFLSSRNIDNPEEIERLIEMIKDPEIRSPDIIEMFKFHEELENTLEHLKNKYLLGVVTNRGRFGVKEVFDLRPIEKYFDTVITYDDCENHKPHPEPLEKALEKLSLHPAQAIYIGDTGADMIAAASIGMPSLHLAESRHNLAHYHVNDFSEIINTIQLIEDANNNS
ncbi:MAG: HAD family hydrolase [Candidatus Saccharimonadales bacterium]